MRARLVESYEIGPDVRHFLFDVPELGQLEFTPGQFVSFSETVCGREVTRAYSICSAPDGNRFELCLNRVREGLFSPWLFEMEPGSGVEMAGPLGFFVPSQPFRDSVLIATGTGIAPFRAFLRWAPVMESGKRITLLFGARYPLGLVYRSEFEALAKQRPQFEFLPTITRPDADYRGRIGWVQQHLDDALDGRLDVEVYICGLREMVDDVRAILKDKGFARTQIHYERYD
ncbi:MAG: FAD-binding oxidoreductase [Bryobacteraceae bacterium]|nr:FAD-binding oxidoreductase [Bryobacteraceae bacterium]